MSKEDHVAQVTFSLSLKRLWALTAETMAFSVANSAYNAMSLIGQLITSPLTISVVAFSLVVLLLEEIRSWYRLKHIPGPLSMAISKFPMARMAATGKQSIHLRELGDKYGPLFRVGPNEVLYGDISTFRMITAPRSSFYKPKWYEGTRFTETDNVVSLSNEEDHKIRRAKLAAGYAGKEGVGFEDGTNKHINSFINLIESKYISTPTDYRPMELAHKLMYLAIDVITELGFGQALGFLANDKDMHNYIEINDQVLPKTFFLYEFPLVQQLLKMWPFYKLAPSSKDGFGFGALMGLMTSIIDNRLKPDAEHGHDMLASELRNGLTRDEVLAEAFVKIIAGTDSSAMAIRMSVLYLLTNPTAFSSLRQEIDAQMAAGKISSPVNNNEANALPYLQAVIRETMRMYPPIANRNWKLVPKGGVTLHGYFIPEGTMVGVNLLYIMRNKEVFGVDADVWRPERWIEAAAEDEKLGGSGGRLRDMLNSVDACFSHGKYSCLGKSLALIEINKVLVELVRRYDFTIADPLTPFTMFEAGLFTANDFWVRITRRQS
ncbi:cytochrome P450 monooxygenase lolP1 [Rhypophila decipiens]